MYMYVYTDGAVSYERETPEGARPAGEGATHELTRDQPLSVLWRGAQDEI